MRALRTVKLTAPQVQTCAQGWLQSVLQWKNHGPKCTAALILSYLLLAATRLRFLSAIARQKPDGPSDQAVRDALAASLPEYQQLLKQINKTLTRELPRRFLRRSRHIAIDLKLIPYYGKTDRDEDWVDRSKQEKGTTRFSAYATACIVHHGMRYTLAVVPVWKTDSHPEILKPLVRLVRNTGVKIKAAMMDRAFFGVDCIEYLKRARVPFVMPVAIRGLKPKCPQKLKTTIRQFLKKYSGWSEYQFRGPNPQRVKICVYAQRVREAQTGKVKLARRLFGCWGYRSDPASLATLYRRRFGIESSYRQVNQARCGSCSRDIRVRLLHFGVALVLRNVWVWLHFEKLSSEKGEQPVLNLKQLPFPDMLRWIAVVLEKELQMDSLPELVLLK